MGFKEWLLTEIQHRSVTPPVSVHGVTIDFIDFRMEDWKKGLNPEKPGFENIAMPSPADFVSGDFSAKLPDGGYLNFVTSFSPQSSGGLALAARPQVQSQITPQPLAKALNDPHWWRFALGMKGNDIVKEPEWPRGDYEKASKPKVKFVPQFTSNDRSPTQHVTNDRQDATRSTP